MSSPSDQPTTFRVHRSIMTARNTQPSNVRRYVMSVTHRSFGTVAENSRSRTLGACGRVSSAFVVTMNLRGLAAKRLAAISLAAPSTLPRDACPLRAFLLARSRAGRAANRNVRCARKTLWQQSDRALLPAFPLSFWARVRTSIAPVERRTNRSPSRRRPGSTSAPPSTLSDAKAEHVVRNGCVAREMNSEGLVRPPPMQPPLELCPLLGGERLVRDVVSVAILDSRERLRASDVAEHSPNCDISGRKSISGWK